MEKNSLKTWLEPLKTIPKSKYKNGEFMENCENSSISQCCEIHFFSTVTRCRLIRFGIQFNVKYAMKTRHLPAHKY